MKNKENRIILFVIFLCFSFLVQQNQINPFENNNKNQNNITTLPSPSTTYNFIFNTTWGTNYEECANGIVVDGSGNVYITGNARIYRTGEEDVFLLKYDSDGNLLWSKSWGGISKECGNGIAVDGSGNMFITGYTVSYGAGVYDSILLKYDTDGNKLWNATWGGFLEI